MRHLRRPTATVLHAALAALAALTLVACADGAGSSAPPAPAATAAPGTAGSAGTAPAPPPTKPGTVVPEALAFDATLVGGQPIDLSDYAGRPVAFWFWAPT